MLRKIKQKVSLQTRRNVILPVIALLFMTIAFQSSGDSIQTNVLKKGTLYADELFWSDENHEVYLKGHVRVNHGDNNFKGKGTFSVFGKVHFLVIDGEPVTLNTSVDLPGKIYEVIELTKEEAIEKYGEEGRFGAIEINAIR